MDKDLKALFDRIEKSNPNQLNAYMQMFDRLLLYTVAAQTIPKSALQAAHQMWLKAARKGIDKEASIRTDFLESTREGRFQKILRQPDGEQLRLEHLKTLDLASDIISRNFERGAFESDSDEGNGFDPDDNGSLM